MPGSRLFGFATLLVLLSAGAARAHNGESQGDERTLALGSFLELVIPDVELELGSDRRRGLALAWPLTFRPADQKFGPERTPDAYSHYHLFRASAWLVFEPQVKLVPDLAARALLGGRANLGAGWKGHLALQLEGGGVAGTDGMGGYGGLGLSVISEHEFELAIRVRRFWTHQGPFWQASFDWTIDHRWLAGSRC